MWNKHLFWGCVKFMYTSVTAQPSFRGHQRPHCETACSNTPVPGCYLCSSLYSEGPPSPLSKTVPHQDPTQPLPPPGLIRIPQALYSGLYLTPTTHCNILVSLFLLPTPSGWNLLPWSSLCPCHPQWPALQHHHNHIH